jgi:acetolactate synthase-1/2/3 large subunit
MDLALLDRALTRKSHPLPRSGGRLVADALVAQGIDHAFAVPGESYLDVLDGLYEVRHKVKLIT